MLGRIVLTAMLLLIGGGVKALGVIPLMYFMYLCFLWFVQCQLLFPTMALQPPEGNPPKDAKISWVDDPTDDGSSEAWYFDNPQMAKAPTVFIFHGNGEYINNYVGVARWFMAMGLNVAIPEYRGYGKSTGVPTEDAIIDDISRHIVELSSEPTFDQTNLIFFGVSVGGGVAASLAVRFPPKAIVLQSTFYSIPRIALDYFIPEFLSRTVLSNIFDSKRNLLRVIERHGTSIFLAHGTEDTIVPYAHAEWLSVELGLSIYSRKCGHNDFYLDGEYKESIQEFLSPFVPVVLRAASP
eukprot:TRINITY_DN20081_c0_g1_i1.p1 TRINITY_DN20081_c0_g1~~TRINITY_DN20081_c0_g1_i1.p1  ORF type:complete len:309 (+),score=45.78 TRINITY_DN20081_c0_g1_i1:40-927(+)